MNNDASVSSTTPSALEQSMKDFIAANGCDYITIALHDYGYKLGFQAAVQWVDKAEELGRGIATGSGDTIAEALRGMTAVLAAKRGGRAIADEALPMGEAA